MFFTVLAGERVCAVRKPPVSSVGPPPKGFGDWGGWVPGKSNITEPEEMGQEPQPGVFMSFHAPFLVPGSKTV